MPKQLKQPPRNEFRFITERTIRQTYFEFTRWQSADLRRKLAKQTYWIQPTGRVILWNWRLLEDYLLNGGDRPEHRALVEEFLATRSNAA